MKYTGVDGLPTVSHETRDQKMDFIERTLIEQQKYINLPLLLDEIGPSSLFYLLKVLDQKLPRSTERELSSVYSQHINAY